MTENASEPVKRDRRPCDRPENGRRDTQRPLKTLSELGMEGNVIQRDRRPACMQTAPLVWTSETSPSVQEGGRHAPAPAPRKYAPVPAPLPLPPTPTSSWAPASGTQPGTGGQQGEWRARVPDVAVVCLETHTRGSKVNSRALIRAQSQSRPYRPETGGDGEKDTSWNGITNGARAVRLSKRTRTSWA